MSNGGRAQADDLGRVVSKLAVAQICETAGFHSFKESALDSLADIAIRYLLDLGKLANCHSNLAGRADCNVFDIIRGLEDLEASRGFTGASEATQCLAESSIIKGIVEFVELTEEVPFAQPLPQFPVIKNRRNIPSFIQMGETPPTKHIPAWLPAFPDPHTYIHTPMWNERRTDPRTDKIEQARQRRKAERSLLSLQQRLVCNGSVGTSTSVMPINAGKDPAGAGNSSFHQDPLQPGEKNVSTITVPSKLSDEMAGKTNVSVLEAFAPAIEAAKTGFCDDGEEGKMGLPDVRPSVHFKIKTGKKFLGEPLDLRLQKKGAGGTASLPPGREEERDDRKRRAEYILRQSMENPHELTQL